MTQALHAGHAAWVGVTAGVGAVPTPHPGYATREQMAAFHQNTVRNLLSFVGSNSHPEGH